MIDSFETLKRQLKELAPLINAFTSEAVQLKVTEIIFRERETEIEEGVQDVDIPSARKPASRKPKGKPANNPAKTVKESSRTRAVAGAQATLSRLIDDGFFNQPRTINAMVDHCETKLALHFKQADFSGKLVRLVRDGRLRRVRNKDGQYEYAKA